MKNLTAPLVVLSLQAVVSAVSRLGAEHPVPAGAVECIPICPDQPGAMPMLFGFVAGPSATAGPAPTPRRTVNRAGDLVSTTINGKSHTGLPVPKYPTTRASSP